MNKLIIPCILLLITSTVSAQGVNEPACGLVDIGTQSVHGTSTVKYENPSKTPRVVDKVIVTASLSVAKGIMFCNSGKYEDAILAFDKTIKLYPNHAIAWNYEGNTLGGLEKYEEAILAFDKTIELYQNYVAAWNHKGEALISLNKHEESRQAYDKAIELDKEYIYAWYNKGNALYILNKYEESLQAYEKVIELDPKDIHAWNGKGNALAGLKNYEESLQAYEKAIELDPKDVSAWSGKSYALAGLKKYEDVLQAYEKLDPKDVFAWWVKGYALYGLKKYEDALQAYDKAIELDPKDISAWNGKGNVLRKLKKYEAALQAYNKAVSLTTSEGFTYNSLGELLYQQGDVEGALHNAELALTKQGEYAPALHLKGRALLEKKAYGTACNCFQGAIVSDKGNLSYIIWDAYANFLKLEFSSKLNQPDKKEKYKEELSLIIRKLERANELSSGNENKKEIKACILYFLAGFYLKNNDIFTAKERLVECISLKAETPIDKSARDMLGIVWNYHIKPPFWVWWCNSPLYKWHKRIGFGFLVFALAGLLICPFFFSQKFLENRIPYLILIGPLIAILFLPNLERIKTQEVEIQLRPPPTFESALSPILMEGQLRAMESNVK